jgi:Ni/Co efflux regulator RcnB
MQADFELKMALSRQDGEFKVAAAQAQTEGQTERDMAKERKKDERQRELKSMESAMIEQRKDRKGEQEFEGAPDIASMLMQQPEE